METKLSRVALMALVGTVAAFASPWAMAHIVADGAPHIHDAQILSSFLGGAFHPLTGLDHLAAMLSVGLWAALTAPTTALGKVKISSALAAPTSFAATLTLGALAGMAGLRMPGVEPMIAASLLVMGLLLATRLNLSTGLGAALVAAFALFHGLAHGAELGGHALAALTGMVLSTAMLHGLGMALGLSLRAQGQRSQQWASRASGGVVALLGLSLLSTAI